MSRIKQLFAQPGDKIIPFITAGYPTKELTVDLVLAAERAGASMIELGMPFSDPLAEGPVIQAASTKALENGVTLKWILKQVHEIRQSSMIPLVLMGYINPVLQYGVERFVRDCAKAGVDGLILPDLPPEEAVEYVTACRKEGVSPIFLVAPNTPDERIRQISEMAGDLIYCVSILGITGTDFTSREKLVQYLIRVKANSTTPFVVGFGIRTKDDVRHVNSLADGAVIGSALVEKLAGQMKAISELEQYLVSIR